MRWTAVSLAIALMCATVNQAVAQKKVALVIGNDQYANEPPLQNPGRDAQHIGAALQKLGFELVGNGALKDLDKATTDSMVRAFETMAQDADIALFYFSGHGRSVDGTNYLLPIDVGSYTRATVGLQTLNADFVVAALEDSRARLKIVLLDACRTPFKGPGGGLGPMRAPVGTVIGFATQPNNTAKQGPPGGVSPYAKALAHFLRVKGLEIFAFFNEVSQMVAAETGNEQEPWVSYSAIRGDPYITPPEVKIAIPATPPVLQGYGRDAPTSPPTELRTSVSLPFIQVAHRQLDHDKYAAARATLTEGIEADPNSALAYSYRGFAWYLEGSTAKDPWNALVAYRKGFPDLDMAIQLDQSYAPVRRHRGNTIVATYKALRALGQPTNDILDRAIDDLKDAVKLDPTSKTNANALGEAYLVKGWYQEAIESFNRAIEQDRSDAKPYSGLCVAYRKLGDWEKARQNAQFAADRDSDFRSRECLTPPSTQKRDAQVHTQVQVIENLQLREQPNPRARNILGATPNDKMSKGSQVAVIDTCRTWMGSGRGAQDADNIWCPVLYEGHRGWANAYFLADDYGQRVACVMYRTARGCASTAGR